MSGEFGFKFEIGQIVEHMGVARTDDTERLYVVQRVLIQCPGGVQREYHCRSIVRRGSLSMNLVHCNEVELRESVPFTPDDNPWLPRKPMVVVEEALKKAEQSSEPTT